MKILSSYSIKGAVGKTALSINLAFAFQQSVKRTLLVDLDRRERRDSTCEKFKAEDDDLGEGRLTSNICESDYPGLNILPSNCLGPCQSSTPSAIGRDAMQDTVLVVEDEADMVDLLRYNLSKAGFGVLIARDGLTGLEIARKNRPDVVILDLLLPHMDGYVVCKTLKNNLDTAGLPIVILTARGEPSERIKALEIGADDYVTKPFNLREVILRIQALLRRSRSNTKNEVLEVDTFQIDKSKFEIRLEGRRLDLTTIEFRLLTLLIERRGRTQSRERLLYDVWGYQNPIVTRTVDTHIRRLRQKLGRHAQRLETVRVEGYRFDALLDPLPADAVAQKVRL